jgi:hypothetical protein
LSITGVERLAPQTGTLENKSSCPSSFSCSRNWVLKHTIYVLVTFKLDPANFAITIIFWHYSYYNYTFTSYEIEIVKTISFLDVTSDSDIQLTQIFARLWALVEHSFQMPLTIIKSIWGEEINLLHVSKSIVFLRYESRIFRV